MASSPVFQPRRCRPRAPATADPNNRPTTTGRRRREARQRTSDQIRWAGPLSRLLGGALLANCLLAAGRAQGQCPEKTMTSFERIGGVTIKDAPLTVLFSAPNSTSGGPFREASQLAELSRQLAGASSAAAFPITAECNNRCRRNAKCRAFLVDYGRHTCWSVEQPAGGGLGRAPTPIHLSATSERTAYFEKVCLNLPASDCERAWIFERTLAHQLHGADDKVIEEVPSRLRCQEHCLAERDFKCRSGEYDYLSMQCRLSAADRHARPAAFRPAAASVDYFENQCAPAGAQCDSFERFDDLDLGRAEIMRLTNSSDQCQQYCTHTIKAFICRSFTWAPLTGKCYLNSQNTHTLGGPDRLIAAPGLVYYQRTDCIDLKLECDTASMTLNLRTSEPFRGRMYVRDEPAACETLGRSATLSSLSIPFQSQARCAQRVSPSRYSSVVVVQQHPLIQRKSDRYIKLVCDFQTANKTITSTYNVVANPWTSTALINATSLAPKIRLRITDKFGNDVTGAKLGDELQLRIEAESESVYDMVARSVLAKSGTTDESIVLIDRDGCPADFRIFPPLRKANKRLIIGRFDAFKFSSDVVVRFQVDVQFCLNSCPPTNCDQAHAGLLLNAPMDAGAQLALGGEAAGAAGDSFAPAGAATERPQTAAGAGLQANMGPSSRPPSDSLLEPFLSTPVNTLDSLGGRRPASARPLAATPPMSQLSADQTTGADLAAGQQVFDGSLTAAAARQLGRDVGPAKQEPLAGNELAAALDPKQGPAGETSQPNRRRRRRRRSIEPMPTAPKHVPLQREIIVIEGPSSAQQQQRQRPDQEAAPARTSKAKVGGPAPDNALKGGDGHKRRHSAAPAAGQLNADRKLELDQDNKALLCTTWSSLVFAVLAFCGLQMLAVGLCLATWLHRQRRSSGSPTKCRLATTKAAQPQQRWLERPF